MSNNLVEEENLGDLFGRLYACETYMLGNNWVIRSNWLVRAIALVYSVEYCMQLIEKYDMLLNNRDSHLSS